jgi:hypothetical protein
MNPYISLIVTRLIQHLKFMQIELKFIILINQIIFNMKYSVYIPTPDDSYESLLHDSRWIVKRDEVIIRDAKRCRYCGLDNDLQVHHVFYIPGRLPWEYPLNLLVTLCRDCHEYWHKVYGIEYCGDNGEPLTLFLGDSQKIYGENKGYYTIDLEAKDDSGKVVLSGKVATWDLAKIEVDINGTPINCHLSHKKDGAWLVGYDRCDGYHFKNMMLKQLNLNPSNNK